MADSRFLEPDLDFIAELKANGAKTMKKCFQCATCSVVCNVTPEEKPFPRKEMIWAQWGLKDKLIYNPDVWLCHQCGDCTTHCPRGAKPMDVLASIRNISYKKLAVPSFLGKMLSSSAFLLPLFALPIVILLVVLSATQGISLPEGEVVYSKLFPVHIIDSIFIPVAVFAGLTAFLSVMKFWKGMKEHSKVESSLNVTGAVVDVVKDIFTHKQFGECTVNKPRFLGHLATFYGFLALFITTNLVMAVLYLFGVETPLPLGHPIKWLGNAGAIATFVGVTWIIARRLSSEEDTGISSYQDWTFIVALYMTVVTGILSEVARLAGIAVAAYPIYFIHLVFVFFLLAYLPFSKFSHMVYRATAMVFARAMNRRKKGLTS